MTWKHFLQYRPFVQKTHWLLVDSQQWWVLSTNGQKCRALMVSLRLAQLSFWTNSPAAGKIVCHNTYVTSHDANSSQNLQQTNNSSHYIPPYFVKHTIFMMITSVFHGRNSHLRMSLYSSKQKTYLEVDIRAHSFAVSDNGFLIVVFAVPTIQLNTSEKQSQFRIKFRLLTR